jgi:hypothetical protein
VDATYTKPSGVPNQLIKNRRVYKGLCMNEADFSAQQQIFNNKKSEILELISEIPNLSPKERNQAKSLINQFYKIINRPASLKNVFQDEECIQEQDILGKKKPD